MLQSVPDIYINRKQLTQNVLLSTIFWHTVLTGFQFYFPPLQIFDGYYHFEHRHVQKRSLNPSGHHQQRLDGDDRVRWAKQQRAKRRPKRDFRSLKSPYTIQLNDPKWGEMWYLVSWERQRLQQIRGETNSSLCSKLFFAESRKRPRHECDTCLERGRDGEGRCGDDSWRRSGIGPSGSGAQLRK